MSDSLPGMSRQVVTADTPTHVFVSVAGPLLDRLTSDEKMLGVARRLKRDELLDSAYKHVCSYVLWVEALPIAHEMQKERARRGKRFLSVLAGVRQNER